MTDLFAAVGKELVVQEPVVTWNLFLTAFLVPTCTAISSGAVIAYMSWKWKKRDAKDRLIEELRHEIEAEKQRVTTQWRENHTVVLCRVKEKVDNIYECLDKKVNKDDCDRLMAAR